MTYLSACLITPSGDYSTRYRMVALEHVHLTHKQTNQRKKKQIIQLYNLIGGFV